MPTGGWYCRGTNILYTRVGVCYSREDQANGSISFQATKAGPATPVPLTIGCMGGLFDALLDLTC